MSECSWLNRNQVLISVVLNVKTLLLLQLFQDLCDIKSGFPVVLEYNEEDEKYILWRKNFAAPAGALFFIGDIFQTLERLFFVFCHQPIRI